MMIGVRHVEAQTLFISLLQKQGPLIKSDKTPFLTKLAIALVSPISLASPIS